MTTQKKELDKGEIFQGPEAELISSQATGACLLQVSCVGARAHTLRPPPLFPRLQAESQEE